MDAIKRTIHLQNEYQKVAAPILERVKGICKDFIGKKVVTAKGLTSKLSDALRFDYKANFPVTPIKGTNWAHVHYVSVQCRYTDIQVEISLCFSDGTTGCVYQKQTWYFGKTDGEILLSINEDYKVEINPIDYETEIKAIERFKALEKELETAKDAIRTRYHSDAYKYV